MNNAKSFTTASAVSAAVAQNHHGNNSGASPLRLSPGPDTPSVTSGGAGGSSSSSSSSCSSSGVGSSAGKMNNQQSSKTGDLSLHELDEALDLGRTRKSSSMPPNVVAAAQQSPLSRSPPVWVPRYCQTWSLHIQHFLAQQISLPLLILSRRRSSHQRGMIPLESICPFCLPLLFP